MTQEDLHRSYREEFRKRKTSRIKLFGITITFLILVGAVMVPLTSFLEIPRLLWAPIIYIIMVVLVITAIVTWRCPLCNARLGDIFKTKYCSKCGFDLISENEEDI